MKASSVLGFLYALSIVILINTPSIKVVFYSTELVNIFGAALLLFISILRLVREKHIKLNNVKLISLITIILLWLVLLTSVYWSPDIISFKNLSQYLSVFLISICIILFSKTEDINHFLKMQIIWSSIIVILHMTGGINIDRSLGQHYLTVGFPIGIGLTIIGGSIIRSVNLQERRKTLFFTILFVIFLLALTSIKGRSPVIMSMATMFLFWLIYTYKQRKNRFKNILIILTTGLVSSIVFLQYASEQWLTRMTRLTETTQEEPRVFIYKQALSFIKDSPSLGYGLGSYNYFTGINYPHNIFLEITFYSGVVGLILFVCFLFIFLKSAIHALNKNNIEIITLSMIATFCLLVWNVSYSLSSSYILFVSLGFVIGVVKDKRRTSDVLAKKDQVLRGKLQYE